MNYQPHQLRVIEEKAQLVDKLEKLRAFIRGDVFDGLPQVERSLLVEQEQHMSRYVFVLAQRIEAFTEKPHG